MISFRPKKTGPHPLVTVREVYDKTCAVERAVGCRWLVSSGIIRDTVQVVTLFSVAIGLGLVLLDIAWPRLRRWLFESPQPVRKRR